MCKSHFTAYIGLKARWYSEYCVLYLRKLNKLPASENHDCQFAEFGHPGGVSSCQLEGMSNFNNRSAIKWVNIPVSYKTRGIFSFCKSIDLLIGRERLKKIIYYKVSPEYFSSFLREVHDCPWPSFLLPTAKEGNVFTGMCHSVHNRPHGYSVTAHPRYGAILPIGKHPTGMLSCLHVIFSIDPISTGPNKIYQWNENALNTVTLLSLSPLPFIFYRFD